jgi:hypothetical protein
MSTSLGNLNRILSGFHAIIGKFYLICFTVFCTIQTRDLLDIVLLHAYRIVVYQKPVLGENNNRILMVVLDYLFPDNTVYIVHCSNSKYFQNTYLLGARETVCFVDPMTSRVIKTHTAEVPVNKYFIIYQ